MKRSIFFSSGYRWNTNYKVGDDKTIKYKGISYAGKIVEIIPDAHGVIWLWVEYND